LRIGLLATRCRRPASGPMGLRVMSFDDLVALEHDNWIAYLTGVVTCTVRATVTRAAGW